MGSRGITVGLAVVVLVGTTAVSVAGSAGGPSGNAAVAQYHPRGHHGHHNGHHHGRRHHGNGGNNDAGNGNQQPPTQPSTPSGADTCSTLAGANVDVESTAKARHSDVLAGLSGDERAKYAKVFAHDEEVLHMRLARGEQSCGTGGSGAGGSCAGLADENRLIEKGLRQRHRKLLKGLSGDTRVKVAAAFKADQKALHDQQKAAVRACKGG
jgi:hypothetical protein